MKPIFNYSLILGVVWLLMASCLTQKPYLANTNQTSAAPSGDLQYSIFLIGESFKQQDNSMPAMQLLQEQVEAAGAQGVALWMGNNGTKRGLPDDRFKQRRAQAEASLTKKLSWMKDFQGKLVMIPGYNDWDAGGPHGYSNVLNQEEFVEELLDKGNVFLPDDACPGPVEVELGEDMVLIILNTQWWLHEWDKPREESECELIEEDDFLVHLEDVLKRNAHKKIILAGHHPLFSNGLHGGYFPAANHLLPPVLGALYVGYRKSIGNRKDLANRRYRAMRSAVLKVCADVPNLVYVSGLENSLQHHVRDNQHFIISGSLDAATGVAAGKGAQFAHGAKGFGKLNVYKNGEVWLEFWTPDNGGTRVYQNLLMKHQYVKPDPNQFAAVNFQNQTASGVGNIKLKRDKKSSGWLGHNYRKEWTATVEGVQVFDIGNEHGGLTPIKRGGGLQTISLRMEAENGKQYVLRSIEKFPEKAVPKPLRGTIASDIVSDQISASHPYAALAIPTMANAVGVYHTNPKLVYVPDDPRLGIYQEDFAEGLFLYEERPAGDWRDLASFGNSKDIMSTLDVIDNLKDKKRHLIDERQVVLSRLFDIVIGDWDRHDDQWRWASQKEDGFTYYQPIPRDRDQAFFWGDGSLLALSSHKWGNPKTQGFHHEIRDVNGLEFNARWFDRTFLTQSDWPMWEEAVQKIQTNLSDEVIARGLSQLPTEILTINGNTIESKLKKRRDDLDKYARQYYEFLSLHVDVVGTKHEELFVITRLANGRTKVQVSSLNKDGEQQFVRYQRTFDPEVTKEIRLYGRGGEDKFEIEGSEKPVIKVRVMGGKGKDLVENKAQGSAASKVLYYDNSNKNNQVVGSVSDRTAPGNAANKYDRRSFKYNTLLPLVMASFNPDDGLYIGTGFIYTKNGFRKEPFAQKHTLTGRYAIKSGSFDFDYLGEFTDVLGVWDYVMAFDINQPSFAEFFYGFGNKTSFDEDIREEDSQFYRARYGQIQIKPALRGNFGKHEVNIGGYFRNINVRRSNNDDEPNRFIINYADLIGRGVGSDSPLLDEARNYLAAFLSYTFDSRDNPFVPRRGLHLHVEGKAVGQLGDEENSFRQVRSQGSFYISTGGTFNTTLAVRVGAEANSGDFEFYQSNRLGGLRNLRGYRIYRFAGDQVVYQNTEVRVKLLDFRTPLFPGQFGFNVFHDVGRSWSDNPDEILFDESLEDWHQGYGGGLWFAPFGQAVIAAEMSTSADEGNNVLFVRLGFMF